MSLPLLMIMTQRIRFQKARFRQQLDQIHLPYLETAMPNVTILKRGLLTSAKAQFVQGMTITLNKTLVNDDNKES